MDEVVQRRNSIHFQKIAEVHVTAHPEVSIVLLLDSLHVGVIALVAEAAVLVATAVTVHASSVFTHCLYPFLGSLH